VLQSTNLAGSCPSDPAGAGLWHGTAPGARIAFIDISFNNGTGFEEQNAVRNHLCGEELRRVQ
jgi:hypothetical protein